MRPILLFVTLIFVSTLPAQDADPGRVVFEGRCARCHGADGNGGELRRMVNKSSGKFFNRQSAA